MPARQETVMKKIGDVMKEMGFNSNAPTDTQKAFIKYLLRVANRNKLTPEPFFDPTNPEQDEWQELKTHSRQQPKDAGRQTAVAHKQTETDKQQQLCFDLEGKQQNDEAC